MKIILSLILFIYCTCTVSIAYEQKMVSFDNSKIVAWKQLDNTEIVLANGQNIAQIATQRDVKTNTITEKIDKSVDIMFVCDCSTSMAIGNRYSILKNSINELIDKLANKFEDKSQIKIGIIAFSVCPIDGARVYDICCPME